MSEKIRVYDQWAGNERGIPEDKTRCVAEVTDFTGWHFYQCQRKRGFGPNGEYCKQHTKKVEYSKATLNLALAFADVKMKKKGSGSDKNE